MGNEETDTFLYFAFGSNLNTLRIRANNPSASIVDVALLQDYSLGFGEASFRWRGGVATIMPDEGKHVYGILWRLNISHMKSLDEQEGVHAGIYTPLEIDVKTLCGDAVKARTYQLTNYKYCSPSYIYLDVILTGAVENGLPPEYVDELRKIEHNNCRGKIELNNFTWVAE